MICLSQKSQFTSFSPKKATASNYSQFCRRKEFFAIVNFVFCLFPINEPWTFSSCWRTKCNAVFFVTAVIDNSILLKIPQMMQQYHINWEQQLCYGASNDDPIPLFPVFVSNLIIMFSFQDLDDDQSVHWWINPKAGGKTALQ